MSSALLALGYPASLAVIARFARVVRERRVGWFVAHQAAVAAIVGGWALRGRWAAAVVNGAWFAVACAWWARGRRSGEV